MVEIPPDEAESRKQAMDELVKLGQEIGYNPLDEDEPTISSLQDCVSLIEKKYGENWRDWAICQVVVIWHSKLFLEDHVKEIVPDLFDLCMEYRQKGTINGHEMPIEIGFFAFDVVDPLTDKMPL